MLDEHHINALDHLQDYSKRMQCSYNNNIIPCSFNNGDFLLYENQNNVNDALTKKEKFSPNLLANIIDENYGFGPYTLTKIYGTPLKEIINAMHLHWHYF